ncbi:MAG: TetR/AcrR family transcriptional regulator [Tetragenococcus koreensis]|uniref:TetR/AcrR family transcriptional regulator n=1 Tax=Tetragenococcus halophilus TaxID=51669 RepID=UPI00209B080B|nr:TetR/AcrR family transcriptional regulator [Tetragenococcus halophilus]MDN6184883.1 TetR/AcrR family transcriptional regulator [Lactococcus lactis]MDN6502689.1 TetR/AcrR family transcriptional regulator [Tetragenococcus koreensis]MCO8292274.1 TetR/AcrR family transcriptional regulator [Tetragenococcus halophilus]MDN6257642.1 TetR/AcrR family transcriptional regulator [Tetragenococcus halophilus]MDN6265937.1 TetR/AcrR family transcriptional regulator [Tetragenococcus halophilus]
MNGFDKRRNEKKEQIIHALTDLIGTKNLKKIGVREIAEHANVSPASIYNFFGSKEELAKQVFFQVTEEVTEETRKLIDDNTLSFKEKVKQLLSVSLKRQELFNSEGLKNFMFEDKSFKKYIDKLVHEQQIPMFMRLIDQGKEEGFISTHISARAIIMYLDTISTMMSNSEVRENMDIELRKEMTYIFMYGLFGDQEPPE